MSQEIPLRSILINTKSTSNNRYESDIPSIVMFSFCCNAVYAVIEKEHSFHAKISMYMQYDCRPIVKGTEFFRPIMSIRNLKKTFSLESCKKKGYSNKELSDMVELKGTSKPIVVRENFELSEEFVTNFNFKYFPFDVQELKIEISSDDSTISTITHMAPRTPNCKRLLLDLDETISSIRVDLNHNYLSEWEILNWYDLKILRVCYGYLMFSVKFESIKLKKIKFKGWYNDEMRRLRYKL